MVSAEFSRGTDWITMDVKGHAGFAELGKDPVCAGASVLAMTVAQCVDAMYQTGKLQKKPTLRLQNGRVTVTAKPKKEYFSEALHVFYVGQTGFDLLAAAYPDYIIFKAIAPPEKG